MPIEVWLLLVDEPAHASRHLRALVDDGERAAADRLVQPADAARSLLGHALRRLAVASQLGVAPEAIAFERLPCTRCGEAHGRPVVVGGRGVEVSLTRTAGLVAVATGPAGIAVGIDAEHRRRAVDAGVVLHPDERATVSTAADVLRTWVRKEAVLKATGTGLTVDPTSFVLGQPGWTSLDVRAADVPDHVVAVAAAASAVDLRVHVERRLL